MSSLFKIRTNICLVLFVLQFYSASPSPQSIKVWNVNGDILSTVRSYTGLFGQKQARVTSLGFHPHEYVFGVGGDDGWISIQGWSGPSQGGDVHGPAGPLHSPLPYGAGHH